MFGGVGGETNAASYPRLDTNSSSSNRRSIVISQTQGYCGRTEQQELDTAFGMHNQGIDTGTLVSLYDNGGDLRGGNTLLSSPEKMDAVLEHSKSSTPKQIFKAKPMIIDSVEQPYVDELYQGTVNSSSTFKGNLEAAAGGSLATSRALPLK